LAIQVQIKLSVTKFIAKDAVNLVTPKVAAKLELLINKLTSGLLAIQVKIKLSVTKFVAMAVINLVTPMQLNLSF
jgi:hypothetical protein